MSKDYYQTLGVSKNATKEEIKKAFRKLAHQYHPDKNDGDDKKFKEINEAYGILSDDSKRAQYDQFGQAGAGGFNNSGFNGGGFGGFDFSQFNRGQAGFENINIDLDDILGTFFGGRRGGWSRTKKGPDIIIDQEIDFKESVFGTTRKINFERKFDKSKEEFTIRIPAGIDNGESLKMKGKGEGIQDGIPGDLYIRIKVKAHKNIIKEGYNLYQEKEIKLSDSILGNTILIDSVEDEQVKVKIPVATNNGEVLRLKNYGVKIDEKRRGDMLIKIKINIPTKLSKKAKEAIEVLQKEGL
jgi:molecular chaperone DnaJ